MEEKLSPRRRLYDRGMRGLVWLCAGLTCALLLFLIGYIFYRGVPGITWSLLTSQTSYIKNTVGILPNLLNTLYIILVAMVIGLLSATGVLVFSERSERLTAMCFITVLIIFFGLVSPRLPFQRHTGLRLPWTVRDEDTWNVAHRILGIISLPLALLYVAASLTLDDFETVSIVTIALWVGLPGVLSYIYYWKKYHGRL